jgi:archaetidylinositol phosphate synthase
VDTFGAFFLCSGLALSGLIDPRIAYALLIVYFILSIDIYLATFTTGEFRLSYWIFGPTELRLAMCIGNIAVIFHPLVGAYRLFDVAGVIAIVVLSLITIVSVIRNVRVLYINGL